MTIKNLRDALVGELRDLLSAERQLVKALPKMVKASRDQELQEALSSHLEETKRHVERLEACLNELGAPVRADTCEAMKGLIEEGEELIQAGAEDGVGDALVIAAAQKVEHYEIASYGTAASWAQLLDLTGVASQIAQTCEDEKRADETLTRLSERINEKAMAT